MTHFPAGQFFPPCHPENCVFQRKMWVWAAHHSNTQNHRNWRPRASTERRVCVCRACPSSPPRLLPLGGSLAHSLSLIETSRLARRAEIQANRHDASCTDSGGLTEPTLNKDGFIFVTLMWRFSKFPVKSATSKVWISSLAESLVAVSHETSVRSTELPAKLSPLPHLELSCLTPSMMGYQGSHLLLCAIAWSEQDTSDRLLKPELCRIHVLNLHIDLERQLPPTFCPSRRPRTILQSCVLAFMRPDGDIVCVTQVASCLDAPAPGVQSWAKTVTFSRLSVVVWSDKT